MYSKKYLSVILALDNSFSTNKNGAIDKINNALQFLVRKLNSISNENDVINIAVISFNSVVDVLTDFTPASQVKVPLLRGQGLTNMGEALEVSVDLLKNQIRKYEREGVDYLDPVIVVLTDGNPNDSLEEARRKINEMEMKYNLKLWIVVTNDADKDVDVNICKSLTDNVLFVENINYDNIFDSLYNGFLIMSRPTIHKDNLIPSSLSKDNNEIPEDWLV